MMMTSGGTVHYKSMFDAGSQIVAKEGTKSLFKGAGANILRGVAGAGVLSLYDKLQQVMFGKVYSGGASILNSFQRYLTDPPPQAPAKRSDTLDSARNRRVTSTLSLLCCLAAPAYVSVSQHLASRMFVYTQCIRFVHNTFSVPPTVQCVKISPL